MGQARGSARRYRPGHRADRSSRPCPGPRIAAISGWRSTSTVTRSARLADQQQRRQDQRPAAPAGRCLEAVPAHAGQGGNSECDKREQLGREAELAETREQRGHPPVNAPVAVPEVAIQADRGAVVGVQGADVRDLEGGGPGEQPRAQIGLVYCPRLPIRLTMTMSGEPDPRGQARGGA